jgi:hypothetical protein
MCSPVTDGGLHSGLEVGGVSKRAAQAVGAMASSLQAHVELTNDQVPTSKEGVVSASGYMIHSMLWDVVHQER